MASFPIIKIARIFIEDDAKMIAFSNGDVLYYCYWYGRYRRLSNKSFVATNLKKCLCPNGKPTYPDDTLIYHVGDIYEVVELNKKDNLTIVKVSKHEIPSDADGILCDFSYSAINKGLSNGSVSSTKSIIVNLYFNDGSRASINATSDPIWLDAEAGMQVEHFTFKSLNFYNLL